MLVCIDNVKFRYNRIEFNVVIDERRFTALVDNSVKDLTFVASSRLISNYTEVNVFDNHFITDILVVGVYTSIVIKDTRVDFVPYDESREDCDLLFPEKLIDFDIVSCTAKNDNKFMCLKFNTDSSMNSFIVKDGRLRGIDESITI